MIRVCDSANREAWLKAREEMVTASDCAMMLRCGWAKTDEERLQQRDTLRTLKAFKGRAMEETESMRMGRCLEPAIIAYANAHMGLKLAHNTTLWASEECPRLGATTDAVMTLDDGSEADVDVKSTRMSCPEGLKPGSTAGMADGVPVYWATQVNAQMAVSGRKRGFILAYHRGERDGRMVRLYEVPRSEALIALILRDVPVFWDSVEALRRGELGV